MNLWYLIIAGGALVGIAADAAFISSTLSVGDTDASVIQPPDSREQFGYVGHVALAGGIDDLGAQFVTAGEPGGKSQSLFIDGRVEAPELVVHQFYEVAYKVFIVTSDGSTLVHDFTNAHTPLGNWYGPMPDIVADHGPFSFYTPNAGKLEGKVRIEQWIRLDEAGLADLTWCPCPAWYYLASVEAALVNGRGSIELAPDKSNAIQPGSSTDFIVRTGAGTWTASITDEVTGATGCPRVSFLTLIPKPLKFDNVVEDGGRSCTASWAGDRSGTLSIQAHEYSAGASNRYVIHLKNSYLEHASDYVVTVDEVRLAPEGPTFSRTPTGTVKLGETVTLTISARANPASQSPIKDFVVRAWYGDLCQYKPGVSHPHWIHNGRAFPATLGPESRYVATAQIKVAVQSNICVEAFAVDATGRPGASTWGSSDLVVLRDVGGYDGPGPGGPLPIPVHEAHPAGTQLDDDDVDSGTILIVLALGVLGAFLAFRFVPGPPVARYASAGVVAIGAVWYLLTLPGVA